MADLIYGKTHEVFGVDSMVEQDYKGYLQDRGVQIDKIAWDYTLFAGLILYEDNSNNERTLESFIEMCHSDVPSLVVIEFCHLTDAQSLWERAEAIFQTYGMYHNLESYETKLAYGLRVEG